jgi:predicted nuclease of predicted toxin-antitoxin system
VKLLFDENLPPVLVSVLADVFPRSAHVHELGLGRADDVAVWQWAKEHDYCIVSKDSDYYDLSVRHGHPPKVIWLRLGNCRTQTIIDCLRNYLRSIVEFSADPEESVLLIPGGQEST